MMVTIKWFASLLLISVTLGGVESHYLPRDLRDVNLAEIDPSENLTHLHKRGSLNTQGRNDVEGVDLNHGYQDMIRLVQFVYSNWAQIDPDIFKIYFHPFYNSQDNTYVRKVFETILYMAQPGGFQHMHPNLQAFRPHDLNEIILKRRHGPPPPILAQSKNIRSNSLDGTITISDFGWQVLYRRFLDELN